MCARASVRATRLALAHLAKQCQHLGPALSAVVQGEDARLHGERRGKVGGGLGFSAAQAKRQTADDRGDRHPHDRTADIEAHSKKGGGKTADDGQAADAKFSTGSREHVTDRLAIQMRTRTEFKLMHQ